MQPNIEVGSKRKARRLTYSIPQVTDLSRWEISWTEKIQIKIRKQWQTCKLLTHPSQWSKCKTVWHLMILKLSQTILEHRRPLTEHWRVVVLTINQCYHHQKEMTGKTSMIELHQDTIWKWKNSLLAVQIRVKRNLQQLIWCRLLVVGPKVTRRRIQIAKSGCHNRQQKLDSKIVALDVHCSDLKICLIASTCPPEVI